MSASPQLSKVPATQSGAERRRSRRRSVVDEQIVTVTLDGDNGGLVLDLAENGLAVQAVAALQQGKATELFFLLPETGVPIRAHGEVRWAEPSGRAGIRLLAFSEGSSAHIVAALQAPPAPVSAAHPQTPAASPSPVLDVDALEREIAARSLDGDRALSFIAERARELTSASGLAIALGSAQEMICRAAAGAAPPLGARLQSGSGLSGECVRTGRMVRCDDTQADSRVDAEVCRQLDLRSAVLVPVTGSGGLCGVLEIFSNRPRAFASDDIRRFEQLAKLMVKLVDVPAPTVAAVIPVAEPAVPEIARNAAPSHAEEDFVSFAEPGDAEAPRLAWRPYKIAVAGIGAAVILALAAWGYLHLRQAAPPAAFAPAVAPVTAAPAPPAETSSQPEAAQLSTAPAASDPTPTPPKEVKPAAKPAVVMTEAMDIPELPQVTHSKASDPVAPPMLVSATEPVPDLAAPRGLPSEPRQSAGGMVPGRLLHRVDPAYPELARQRHIGGTVVLNAIIRPDGRVGTVAVVSGNPLLAHAAVEAVRQWRYEPFRLHGSAVQAEATIRLKFNPELRMRSDR